MTKRTRRILFYSFILFFLILGLVVILIALGYGYDFTQNKIVKTGALGVKTSTGASVYINDELKGETSFLTNTFTKSRLVPGQYQVRIENPDIMTWQKKVIVEAGFYTDFPSINLLPKQFKQEAITKGELVGSDLVYGNWLIYFSEKGFLTYRSIRPSADQTVRELDGSASLAVNKKFQTILFDDENGVFLVSSGTVTYLLDPTNNTLNLVNKLPFAITNRSYFRNNIAYGLNKNRLIAHDLTSGLNTILVKNASSFAANKGTIAFINPLDNALYTHTLENNQVEGPINLETKFSSILSFVQHDQSNFAILQGDSLPALFKLEGNKMLKLSTYSEGMKLSPSQNKLMYHNPFEVSVLYINATGKQPLKSAGEKELIDRISTSFKLPDWYTDEEHILVNKDSNLTFIELDGRGGRNSYNLISDVSGFNFDSASDTVYFLSNGIISKMVLH